MNNNNRDYFSIFSAAANNDLNELKLSLSAGQRFDDVEPDMLFTPLHIACIAGSLDFILEAMKFDFDLWKRDKNGYLAIDHAAAKWFRPAQRAIFSKMYGKSFSSPEDSFTP
jgi:ankyrin repeat protein